MAPPRPNGASGPSNESMVVARVAAMTLQALLDHLSEMGNEGLQAVLVLRASGQKKPMVVSLSEDLHATKDDTRKLLEAAYEHVLEVAPSEEGSIGG